MSIGENFPASPKLSDRNTNAIPISMEPIKFAASVPYGSSVPSKRSAACPVRYLQTDPIAPPIATCAIVEINSL